MHKAMQTTLQVILLWAIAFSTHAEWDHAVIMNPHEGATYTVPVPLNPGVPNCVYVEVTDCKDPPTKIPSAAPEPPVISEIPTPRGTEGWSFGVPIDRVGWTVEVDNTEDADSTKAALYHKDHAIDEDVTTIWHTRWVDPAVPMPHWIVVDMQTEHWVDGMVIHPRPWHGPDCAYCDTSNVKDYEVWVSKDNNIWARVANGTLTFTEGAPQTIEFLIPNQARYVRLNILNASGDTPAVAIGDIQITESLRDIEITGAGVS